MKVLRNFGGNQSLLLWRNAYFSFKKPKFHQKSRIFFEILQSWNQIYWFLIQFEDHQSIFNFSIFYQYVQENRIKSSFMNIISFKQCNRFQRLETLIQTLHIPYIVDWIESVCNLVSTLKHLFWMEQNENHVSCSSFVKKKCCIKCEPQTSALLFVCLFFFSFLYK